MPQEEALARHHRTAAPDDVLEAAVRLVHGARTVVIDGRSGAGKTTLARMLAGRLNARLVSLDEIYPGWDGLSYATEEAARLVRLHAAGERATYRRWDWTRDEWGEEAAVIDETIPLIVEGCGALTAASASAADASIWMDEDPAVRRQRACDRDGDAMRSQWDRWAAQESAHIAAHNPAGLADMRIDPALSSDLAPE